MGLKVILIFLFMSIIFINDSLYAGDDISKRKMPVGFVDVKEVIPSIILDIRNGGTLR